MDIGKEYENKRVFEIVLKKNDDSGHLVRKEIYRNVVKFDFDSSSESLIITSYGLTGYRGYEKIREGVPEEWNLIESCAEKDMYDDIDMRVVKGLVRIGLDKAAADVLLDNTN